MSEIAMSVNELIARFAEIQNISIEEARQQIGAETEEQVLKNIQNKTIEKINSTQVPMNRARRRALKKKLGAQKYAEMVARDENEINVINDTAKKLNYIDLIQKFRTLNEKKEQKENGESNDEED